MDIVVIIYNNNNIGNRPGSNVGKEYTLDGFLSMNMTREKWRLYFNTFSGYIIYKVSMVK